jgi:hypothetical protein
MLLYIFKIVQIMCLNEIYPTYSCTWISTFLLVPALKRHVVLAFVLRSTPNHLPLKFTCSYSCKIGIGHTYVSLEMWKNQTTLKIEVIFI